MRYRIRSECEFQARYFSNKKKSHLVQSLSIGRNFTLYLKTLKFHTLYLIHWYKVSQIHSNWYSSFSDRLIPQIREVVCCHSSTSESGLPKGCPWRTPMPWRISSSWTTGSTGATCPLLGSCQPKRGYGCESSWSSRMAFWVGAKESYFWRWSKWFNLWKPMN